MRNSKFRSELDPLPAAYGTPCPTGDHRIFNTPGSLVDQELTDALDYINTCIGAPPVEATAYAAIFAEDATTIYNAIFAELE